MKSLKIVVVAVALSLAGVAFAADKLEQKSVKLEGTKGSLFLHLEQQVVDLDREIASTEQRAQALKSLRGDFQKKLDAVVKPITDAARFSPEARVSYRVDDEGAVWLSELLPAPVTSATAPDKK